MNTGKLQLKILSVQLLPSRTDILIPGIFISRAVLKEKLISDIWDKEIIILFKGKNLDDDEADDIVRVLEENYPNAQVGRIDGDQDTYGVLIGIS